MFNPKLFVIFFLFLASINASPWHETLPERATNPISNLSQLQTENDFSPSNYGTTHSSNLLLIKPLIALEKGKRLPCEQLIRIKIQIPKNPGASTALGDTQSFDLFVFEEKSFGRWGIGPMAIFPTATKKEAGQGKWQLGPACGLTILRFPKWQIGFLAQNPISIGGEKKRGRQNSLLFQPFLIRHFRHGYYLISNSEWTINWIAKTHQIPVNCGAGRVGPLFGKQKVDLSLQFAWMASQNATKNSAFVNQATIQLCCNFLLI